VSTPSLAGKPSLRIRGVSYPVILPSWRDPRLHLASVFVTLHIIGQVEFNFRLSIPQILASVLTCALLEVGITFWQKRVVLWPASAMLTGNGIAFILRVPGTHHGDWWSFHGVWIYIAVAAVSLLSKYLIRFRGRHIFNPSNFGLVLFFLVLGSSRTEPLEFWWGPTSPWLVLVLAIIVGGALAILSRLNLLAVAALFWVTFAVGIGVLGLSGHAMTANWHLGPVSDGYFWKVLILSPEVFIFLSFMITDPKTVPTGRIARRIYAVSIGLLSALLIAPQTTEFGAKVALLGSLTLVCAGRPILILLGEATTAQRGWLGARLALVLERLRAARRGAIGAGALGAAALFAIALVLAGIPARSSAEAGASAAAGAAVANVTVSAKPGVSPIDMATGRRIARDTVADLDLAAAALRSRDARRAAVGAGGAWLRQLQEQIRAAAGGSVVVPAYHVERAHVSLEPGVGQGPPRVVSTLEGTVERSTYSGGSLANREAATPFKGSYELSLEGSRFVIVADRSGASATPGKAGAGTTRPAVVSKGTAAFAGVKLTDVAAKVGIHFRQAAFRYGMSADAPAMMGGGLCWLDYNNDGWMDLFAVNSYADANVSEWLKHGGFPRSALYENVKGRFVNVSRSSGADLAVRGSGCVAADFNGDGYTDLFVTTAVDDKLLWNNGNGTFSQGARSSGVVSFGWHAGAAVADVNGDGRPDLFVAGYTNPNVAIPNSVSGFPTNHLGVRDLLFLNEGNGPNGRAKFREVGVQAGLERAHFEHGLGAVFTDVNGDGRPDLYVANDEDPNRLYINVPRPGAKNGLDFHFVERGKAEGVDDKNAGMGVAPGDYNGDGKTDLFVTNSRGQPHAVFESAPAPVGGAAFRKQRDVFEAALQRQETVGWGDSWADLNNDGHPDLVVANGAIPVMNLRKDTEPIQVLENLAGQGTGTPVGNASGVIDQTGLPKIIGRGLAAADFNNDGHVDIAINSIGGPLVLLENRDTKGNWLEVSLKGFHPGALVTATLPGGRKLVEELHAGSSYLSSEDPRLHFGLGSATKVASLTVRYPDGHRTRLANVAANQILTVKP
jgi:hypothetical protein